MNTHLDVNSPFNDIYTLNPKTTPKQIVCATRRSLKKADALVTLLSVTDTESISANTWGDCLWVLGDLIHEARSLYRLSFDKDAEE